MRSELREALRIPDSATPAEAARVCGAYYALYRAVADTCADPFARSLAQERIRLLEASAAEEGVALSAAPAVNTDPPRELSPGQTELWLSGVGARLPRSQYESKLKELERMPESAEKYYLLGCVRLNAVNYGAETVEGVARCFDRALALDGENVAYRLAVNALEDARRDYADRLNRFKEDASAELDEKIHAAEAEAIRQKVWTVVKKIGTGLAAVLGAAAAAVAGAIALICECSDGC